MEINIPPELEAPVTLLQWNYREGESFRSGEALVELITPQGCHAIAAVGDGLLAEIYVANGCRVEPGEPVARLEASG